MDYVIVIFLCHYIGVEYSIAALRVAGSISTRTKYLHGLQVVVPGLAVCVCEFKCL